MGYLDTTPGPLRKHEIPGAVKALLSTSRMDALLYGSARVYSELTRPVRPEAEKSKAWGRVVVMLADYLYPRGQAMPGRGENVAFLVRMEVNQPGPTFDYVQALEAIHEEAFKSLSGQKLVLAKASVMLGVFWRGMVNQRPLWDPDNGVWVMTSEYRTVLEPVSA